MAPFTNVALGCIGVLKQGDYNQQVFIFIFKKKTELDFSKNHEKNQTLKINLFHGKMTTLIATIKDKHSTVYGLYLHQIEVYNMIYVIN